MMRSFDDAHALAYGVDEAIALHSFQWWIDQHQGEPERKLDGRAWVYMSLDHLTERWRFWNRRKIQRVLDSLVRQQVLRRATPAERAALNEATGRNKYLQTAWYAFEDEAKFLTAGGSPDEPDLAPSRRSGSGVPDQPILVPSSKVPVDSESGRLPVAAAARAHEAPPDRGVLPDAAAAAPADRDGGETCTAPESNPPSSPSKPQSSPPNPQSSPPNPQSSAADPAAAAIAELLHATGWFPRGMCASLAWRAIQNRNTRTPEVVAARIRHAEASRPVAQRPGHVRSAIVEDWEPPAGFIAEQRRAAMEAIERDRQRKRVRAMRQEPTPEQVAARELDRQVAIEEWRTAFPEYAARRERRPPPTDAELAVRDEIRRREAARRQVPGTAP